MISWAAAATDRYGLAPYVDKSLDDLCIETEDTVYFSLLSGNEAVCVDRREGSYPIKTLSLSVGDRRPLGVGSGSLALLAFQPDPFVETIIRDGESRRMAFGMDTKFLREEIDRTRKAGFALVVGQLIQGMSGIAAPICRTDGSAVAAIAIAAITSRISGSRLPTIAESLKREARRVEEIAQPVLNAPFARRHSTRRGP